MNVVQLRQSTVPRGPRGKVLIRKGQTWVTIHNGKKHTVTQFENGRVVIKPKGSRNSYGQELSEQTFRSTFKVEEDYLAFCNGLKVKLEASLDARGASPGMYSFFNLKCTPPDERGKLSLVKEKPKLRMPRKGDIWRPRNFRDPAKKLKPETVTSVSRSRDGVHIIMERPGSWGCIKYVRAEWHEEFEFVESLPWPEAKKRLYAELDIYEEAQRKKGETWFLTRPK